MNTRLEKGFGQVSTTVMKDPSLAPGAKVLYSYLSVYTSAETNTTFVSMERICAELSLTRSTIKRNMSILIKAGIVTRYRVNGKWYTKLLK